MFLGAALLFLWLFQGVFALGIYEFSNPSLAAIESWCPKNADTS